MSSAYDEVNLNNGGAMETIHKLELSLEQQYDKLPHLPVHIQKWFAENAWWLILIGVAISALGLVGLLSVLAIAMFGLTLGGAVIGSGVGATVGAAIGGIVLVTTIISIALYVVETAILGLAVSPLKSLKKRGWDLLFIVAVINAAVIIVVNIISLNIFGLIWSLLWVGVGVYFLYEIRSFFIVKKHVSKKEAEPAKQSVKA